MMNTYLDSFNHMAVGREYTDKKFEEGVRVVGLGFLKGHVGSR